MSDEPTTTKKYSSDTYVVKTWGHHFNRGTGNKTYDIVINIILQLISLIIGFLLLALGVLRFFPVVQYTFNGKASTKFDVINVVIAVYVIIFGIMIMIFSLFFPKIRT